MNSLASKFLQSAETIIFGKTKEIKLGLTCLLADGHLLIEDVPGVGKTTFAKTIAKLCHLSFARIQFTNDLMPSDLIGIQIYSSKEENFKTIPGPLLNQFILADELNRGTPKTQSALLEAMEEKQITLDGNTIKIQKPFFVIATQNPRTQIGTHLLPESQLDRFMMKIKIGYPDPNFEKELLKNDQQAQNLENLNSLFNQQSILEAQKDVQNVFVSDAIYEYILRLLTISRTHSEFQGLSPRAGKDILKATKAWAYIHKRDHVLPDDIQEILPNLIAHRLPTIQGLSMEEELDICRALIHKTPVD